MKSLATAALAVLALQTTLGEARRLELSDVKGLLQSETSKRVQTCIYQGFDDEESTAGIKVLNEANGAVVPIFKTFEGTYAETGVTKRDKAGKKRVMQASQKLVKDAFLKFIKANKCTTVQWLTHGSPGAVHFTYTSHVTHPDGREKDEVRQSFYESSDIHTDVPDVQNFVFSCLCSDPRNTLAFCQEQILHPVKLSSGQYGFTTTEAANSREQLTQFMTTEQPLATLWSTGAPLFGGATDMVLNDDHKKAYAGVKALVHGQIDFYHLNAGTWTAVDNIDEADWKIV